MLENLIFHTYQKNENGFLGRIVFHRSLFIVAEVDAISVNFFLTDIPNSDPRDRKSFSFSSLSLVESRNTFHQEMFRCTKSWKLKSTLAVFMFYGDQVGWSLSVGMDNWW